MLPGNIKNKLLLASNFLKQKQQSKLKSIDNHVHRLAFSVNKKAASPTQLQIYLKASQADN